MEIQRGREMGKYLSHKGGSKISKQETGKMGKVPRVSLTFCGFRGVGL